MSSPKQRKSHASGPVIVTANRLWDGVVVYRTRSAGWTRKLSDAEVFRNPDEAQAALKEAQAGTLAAVGVYLAPIDASRQASLPGNLREIIRLGGPTFPLPRDVPGKVAA
jgi:hypothetical protein